MLVPSPMSWPALVGNLLEAIVINHISYDLLVLVRHSPPSWRRIAAKILSKPNATPNESKLKALQRGEIFRRTTYSRRSLPPDDKSQSF
jgi:hypothetical protein